MRTGILPQAAIKVWALADPVGPFHCASLRFQPPPLRPFLSFGPYRVPPIPVHFRPYVGVCVSDGRPDPFLCYGHILLNNRGCRHAGGGGAGFSCWEEHPAESIASSTRAPAGKGGPKPNRAPHVFWAVSPRLTFICWTPD